jgi:hypothetical protein
MRISHAKASERRAWVRYACDLHTSCRSFGQRGHGHESWPARIGDISAGGLCLVLHRRFEPETLLLVELPDGPDSTRSVLARVQRVDAIGREQWKLGCSLMGELGRDDLRALVAAAAPNRQPAGS